MNTEKKQMPRAKKIALLVILLVALLGGGGSAYVYYSGSGDFASNLRGILGGGGAGGEKPKKQLWTCGMHPQVIKDAPGSCPICGMDLVPLKTENHEHKKGGDGKNAKKSEEELIIKIQPSVIQKMGMRTEIVRTRTISREIRAVAHVDFNEERQTIINSRVNGWVERLYARYTGQTIRRGQALAAIYSPELVSTQREYLEIYKRMKSFPEGAPGRKEAMALLSSARRRLSYWNISSGQIKYIEEKGKVNRHLVLYSPYSGVVVEKKVVQGARIKEGMDLFKIVDLSTVWAYVHISEKDIPFVKRGMAAEMIVPQVPGKTFKGRVSFIFPYMNTKTRDLKIRVTFRNHGFQLRPGMYSTLILKRTLPGKHVVVPSSAVIRTGAREIAFVYKGDGVFSPREIQTGVTDAGENIQVLKGLKAGEAIVVSGQFLLDSETRIQEAIRKLRKDGSSSAKKPGGHNH